MKIVHNDRRNNFTHLSTRNKLYHMEHIDEDSTVIQPWQCYSTTRSSTLIISEKALCVCVCVEMLIFIHRFIRRP